MSSEARRLIILLPIFSSLKLITSLHNFIIFKHIFVKLIVAQSLARYRATLRNYKYKFVSINPLPVFLEALLNDYDSVPVKHDREA